MPVTELGELAAQLAEILEYDEPIPLDVAKATITHPDFGRRLVASRGNRETIRHLIARAPSPGGSETRFAFTGARAPAESDAAPRSGGELVAQASRSLLRWAATAFRTVDDATYERRMTACAGCEHLAEPAGNVVYDITKALSRSANVCGLCGCVVSMKARVPHESCPAAHPCDSSLTRWGEPRTNAARTSTPKEMHIG